MRKLCSLHIQVQLSPSSPFFFFFNDTATTEIYTLSLHDALPISSLDADDAESPNERGAERATRRIGETQDDPRGRGVLLRPIVPSRTRPQGAAEAHDAGLAHGGYQRGRRRGPGAARFVGLREGPAGRPNPLFECG